MSNAVKDVERAHQLVVLRVMMFSCIISSIEDAFTPEICELALGISTLEPVKALTHRFRSLGCHGTHGEPKGRDVVSSDRGGLGLVMT